MEKADRVMIMYPKLGIRCSQRGTRQGSALCERHVLYEGHYGLGNAVKHVKVAHHVSAD